MTQKNISLEIFRDVECAELAIEDVERGVNHVRRIATGLAIVRSSRLIRLHPDSSARINIFKTKWPAFDADLNIIVTNKLLNPLDDTLKESVSGMSRYNAGAGALKVAVLDLQTAASHDRVAAHETAHLLGVKAGGKLWDGQGHCVAQGCLMRSDGGAPPVGDVQQRVYKRVVDMFTKHRLQIEAPSQPPLSGLNDFCAECAVQLDTQAQAT
jgi:hypothetical protein